MSDSVDAELKATGQEFSRNIVSKKADRVFGTVLDLKTAVKAAKRNKVSTLETRVFPINVSDVADAALGSLRADLANLCKALKLTCPLLDHFKLTFDIEVKTGAAIWALIESNKFWEQAQTEVLATCRDEVASQFLERIRKSGVELRGQLNRYAALAQLVEGPLPADVQKGLQADVEAFTKVADRYARNMGTEIEIRAGQGAVDLIKKQLKLEKDILKYRGGKSAIVFIDTGLIAGHIAHMVGSFGATAPLAIIACVRLVVEIGQIAVKAALDLEQLGMLIDFNVAVVMKAWGTDGTQIAKVNQATLMEGFSQFVQGVTKLELPSVGTIKTQMNDYQHKLNVLTSTYNDLGFELARLQRIVEAYTDILSSNSKRMTREQKDTVGNLIDGANNVYAAINGKALGDGGKRGRMEQAAKNIEGWLAVVQKLEEVTSKYSKWIGKLANIAASAGLGLGSLGGELLHLTHELTNHANELAHLVHEHADAALITEAHDKVAETIADIEKGDLKAMGEAVVVLVADGGLAELAERLAEVRG